MTFCVAFQLAQDDGDRSAVWLVEWVDGKAVHHRKAEFELMTSAQKIARVVEAVARDEGTKCIYVDLFKAHGAVSSILIGRGYAVVGFP